MNLIVNADKNWGIGKNNELLVHIPNDMKMFRQMTTGKVVVMGRKTLESFPGKRPLKNRVNIVITKNQNYKVDGAIVVHSIEEAVEKAKGYNEDVYVIGGVCRKKEAKDAISFSNNAIHSRKHMEYHSLSKSKADRHMEPFIIDVMPTEDTDFVLSSHEGEEFIMVMEGIMEISYGKNTYLLEEGDSIYYDSIVPHHVHAYEGQAAKILAVIYTPI